MTQVVEVRAKDAAKDAPVGKVPARAVPTWLAKGFELVDPEKAAEVLKEAGVSLEDGKSADEPPEAVSDPDASPAEIDPVTTDPGTAADSADNTSTDSGPKNTGRAGKGR